MFRSKLDRFIVKRVAVLFILLTAADLAFLGNVRWLIFYGLLAGSVISIARFCSNEWIMSKIICMSGGKAVFGSIIAFTLNQIVLIPVIAIPYFYNIMIFYGLISGIMLIPVIIMLNSITEAFGITSNHFEQGGELFGRRQGI